MQILDGKVAGDGPPETQTKTKADAMREHIMAARADQAADRAATNKKGKTGKKGKTNKAKKKVTKPTKAMKKVVKKPKSWLKARPTYCAKCRYIPGCTKSCYVARGEKVPK